MFDYPPLFRDDIDHPPLLHDDKFQRLRDRLAELQLLINELSPLLEINVLSYVCVMVLRAAHSFSELSAELTLLLDETLDSTPTDTPERGYLRQRTLHSLVVLDGLDEEFHRICRDYSRTRESWRTRGAPLLPHIAQREAAG